MSRLVVAEEVQAALDEGRAVVALETTIVAHGFPSPEGLAVGRECEERVRAGGAVPATVAILDGAMCVGLSDAELELIGTSGSLATKVGPRDIGACIESASIGATTVGGTLAACRRVGIRFMATGGIGGVHRGYAERPDVSADLTELARTQALVVCSGVKSLLDVEATMERLETLGVPVLGWQTDELPLFYTVHGGPRVPHRVDTAAEAAALARAQWELSDSSIVLTRPPAGGLDDVEPLIEEALAEAAAQHVTGQSVTPFVLAFLHERSGGRTLEVNRRLAADNAALAAEVAVAFSSSA